MFFFIPGFFIPGKLVLDAPQVKHAAWRVCMHACICSKYSLWLVVTQEKK